MEEIKNKVKESSLIQMDLADFKPKEKIVGLDLASQLWQGLVLKNGAFCLVFGENMDVVAVGIVESIHPIKDLYRYMSAKPSPQFTVSIARKRLGD